MSVNDVRGADDERLTGKDIAPLIAGVGFICLIVRMFTEGEAAQVVSLIAMVALFTAVGVAVGSALRESARDKKAEAPRVGSYLVGSHVRVMGNDFTIIDDSSPSTAAAVNNGGRGVVTAVDQSGRVGLLFLGFDASGAVVEASTADSGWHHAEMVH